MATLTRETIQSLAVLRAISTWQRGAYGQVRVQKTLFLADQDNDPDWTLFTYKRWFLGQYSDTISDTLNGLRRAGRIRSKYDGPSERINAILTLREKTQIRQFFTCYFPEWTTGFDRAFQEWAYLTNDSLIKKAHDDPSYTMSKHGQIILRSRIPKYVQFSGLSKNDAEELTDMVNGQLQSEISKRLNFAASKRAAAEDWNGIYFGDD